jgi:hypothetical protein
MGFQSFVSDGDKEFGAVRAVAPAGRQELAIYVAHCKKTTATRSTRRLS